MIRYFLTITLLVGALRAVCSADLVEAKLVADVSAVRAGEPFMAGVVLHITPGWHVYWINPGDSGIPTTVKWQLPPGFKAGPLQYPVPERLDLPGDVVNFGYEKEVMLLAKITPPADLKASQDVTVGAQVNWLCCKDLCLPGKAKVQMTLKTADAAARDNEKLFATWTKRLPTPAEKTPGARDVKVTVDQATHAGIVSIEWNKPPTQIQLLPGPSEGVSVKNVKSTTQDKRTEIHFNLELLAGQSVESDHLPALVAYTDADGERHAMQVNIPISPAK